MVPFLKAVVSTVACLKGVVLVHSFSHTNDLPYALDSSSVVMYADDSTLFHSHASISELSKALEQELDAVFNWISKNNMVLNLSKTKSMLIGSKQRLHNSPCLPLTMKGSKLEQVNQFKLLGVTVDHHLSWSHHIDCIISKMGKGIAVVRRCSSLLTPIIMKNVVRSLVLCHLEYCSLIWSAANKTNLKRLQLVQNKAARLILKCSYSTSVTEMHQRLSWPLVNRKLWYNLLVFLKKVILTGQPHSFYERLQYSNQIHSHFTRFALNTNLIVTRPNTNFLQKSVFFRASQEWNKLPKTIKELTSICVFKTALKSHLNSTI